MPDYTPNLRYKMRAGGRIDIPWDLSDVLAELGDDTIDSAEVSAATGLETDFEGYETSSTDTVVTAWFQGGAAGQEYAVSCAVTTSSGRILQYPIIVEVV
jgi:hypothetical protein